MPDTFSSAGNLFGYRWNCSGGADLGAQERERLRRAFARQRRDAGGSRTPSSRRRRGRGERNADGSFHVAPAGDVPNANFRVRHDMPFVIVVI